jgi:hypothetical protein
VADADEQQPVRTGVCALTLAQPAVLYDGLKSGELTPEDLDPDLAGVQVWVRFEGPCRLHPEGDCPAVTVHEFAADATSCSYAYCDPDGPMPETTTDVGAVRLLWSNGLVEAIGPSRQPSPHPVLGQPAGAPSSAAMVASPMVVTR